MRMTCPHLVVKVAFHMDMTACRSYEFKETMHAVRLFQSHRTFQCFAQFIQLYGKRSKVKIVDIHEGVCREASAQYLHPQTICLRIGKIFL